MEGDGLKIPDTFRRVVGAVWGECIGKFYARTEIHGKLEGAKSVRFGHDGEISVAAWRKLEREKACAEAAK